jgi:5-methyltetrahydrofolate--homocysteine methyltransferase
MALSRPDIIQDIHADFFRVACDIVETNTFGGSSILPGAFERIGC